MTKVSSNLPVLVGTCCVFLIGAAGLVYLAQRPFGADWEWTQTHMTGNELRDALAAPPESAAVPGWGAERMELQPADPAKADQVRLKFPGIAYEFRSKGVANPGPVLPMDEEHPMNDAGTSLQLEGASMWIKTSSNKSELLGAYDANGHSIDASEVGNRGWNSFGLSYEGIAVPTVWLHFRATGAPFYLAGQGVVSSDGTRSLAFSMDSNIGGMRGGVGFGAFHLSERGTRCCIQVSHGNLESVSLAANDMAAHDLGPIQVRRLGTHPKKVGGGFGWSGDSGGLKVTGSRCVVQGATDWVVLSAKESPGRVWIRGGRHASMLPRLVAYPHDSEGPADLVVERRAGSARLLVRSRVAEMFRSKLPANLLDYKIRIVETKPLSSYSMANYFKSAFGIHLPDISRYESKGRKVLPKDGMTLRELVAEYLRPAYESGKIIRWNPSVASFEIEEPWYSRLWSSAREFLRK